MEPSTPSWPTSIVAPLVTLVATIALISLGLKTVLRLPGVPYNVSELFLDHASIPVLVIFSLALLWVGAGSMLLAHWLIRSRHPYLVLPVGATIVAMISRTLLKYSVTYESLDDVLGTSNLFSRVTVDKIWGGFWQHAFLVTNHPDLVEFFERRIRYLALYSLLTVCLAAVLVPIAGARQRSRPNCPLWVLAVSVAVWLWISKLIVIDGAATDNLTELIAPAALFGLGGGPYLYLIVVLMATTVALLVRTADSRSGWPGWLLALGCSMIAIPAGWLLLGAGLDQHIEKYDTVFSGTQFLLGPDRQHTLSTLALFSRWAVVQGGGVALMSIGAWIAHRLVPPQPD